MHFSKIVFGVFLSVTVSHRLVDHIIRFCSSKTVSKISCKQNLWAAPQTGWIVCFSFLAGRDMDLDNHQHRHWVTPCGRQCLFTPTACSQSTNWAGDGTKHSRGDGHIHTSCGHRRQSSPRRCAIAKQRGGGDHYSAGHLLKPKEHHPSALRHRSGWVTSVSDCHRSRKKKKQQWVGTATQPCWLVHILCYTVKSCIKAALD